MPAERAGCAAPALLPRSRERGGNFVRQGNMFDFGFSELVVIGVVMLIVVGPERLPKVARTAGHLLGRLQRYVSDVKSDIQREMQLEELKKLQQQVQQQAQSLESSVRSEVASVESELGQAVGEIKEMPAAASAGAAAVSAASSDSAAPVEDTVVTDPGPQLELGLDQTPKQAVPADKA